MSQLAAGNDPATGRPFGNDVAAIFDTFLRRNVPEEGDAFFTFVSGNFHALSPPPSLEDVPRLVAARPASRNPAGGSWRPRRAPSGGRRSGCATPRARRWGRSWWRTSCGGERDEIADAINTGFGGGGGSQGRGGGRGRLGRGRADPAPIRDVTATARASPSTDLSRRIPSHGDDEIADAGPHLQRHARPARDAFATQRAVHRRRRPRAAHADHHRPRPPRADGRRPRRAPRETDRPGHRRARPDEPDRRRPAAARQGRAARLPRTRSRSMSTTVHPRPVRQGPRARRRDWRVDGGADGHGRGRPAAPHPGGDEPGPATPSSTPARRRRSRIGSRGRRTARLRIWVRDTGPGVAADGAGT